MTDEAFNGLKSAAIKVKRERDKFRTALLKYVHCRHGGVDCPCTNEARAALYEPGEEEQCPTSSD